MKTLLFLFFILSFTVCLGKSNFKSHLSFSNIRTDTFRMTLDDTAYFNFIPAPTPEHPELCIRTFKNIGQTGYFIFTYSKDFKEKVFEGNFKNGKQEGIWLTYSYKFQVVNSKESYLNGKAHGEWIQYDDVTGRIKKKQHYTRGKKSGKWYYYDDNGKVIIKEIYKNDMLIREEFF